MSLYSLEAEGVDDSLIIGARDNLSPCSLRAEGVVNSLITEASGQSVLSERRLEDFIV